MKDFELTLQLLREADTRTGNAIIDRPCGSGKTRAATVYAGAEVLNGRRFWFIKPTLKDCRTQQALFRRLDVPCGLLSGYNSAQCVDHYPKSAWRRMYDLSRTPCRNCRGRSSCDFAHTLFPELRERQMAMPIVVMTSSRFITLWESKAVAAGVAVIVDEEPCHWETFELPEGGYGVLWRAFAAKRTDATGSTVHANIDVAEAVREHIQRVQQSAAGGACRIDPERFDADLLSSARRYLHLKQTAGMLSDEEVELAHGYLNFMHGDGVKYAMAEGDTIRWIRDCVLVDLPNKVIMLSASATFSSVRWPGFTILRSTVDEGRRYPNLTIHALPFTGTRTNLRRSGYMLTEAAHAFLASRPEAKCFLLTNKTCDDLPHVKELLGDVGDREGSVHMTRGSVIGSNEARNCDVAVLAASCFTRVDDYVLRAAAVNQHEFDANLIWNSGKKSPKMKAGGFVDPEVDLEFRRQTMDELHQSLMRGCIREDNMAEYHVFCMIPGFWALVELERLVPGFQLEVIEHADMQPRDRRRAADLAAYVELRDGRHEELTVKKAARLCGYKSTKPQIRHEVADRVLITTCSRVRGDRSG